MTDAMFLKISALFAAYHLKTIGMLLEFDVTTAL